MKKTIIGLSVASLALAYAVAAAPAASAQQSPTLPNIAAKSSDNPEDSSFQLIPCDGVKKQKLDANGNPVFETFTNASGTKSTKPVYVEGSEECGYKHLLILANRIVNFLLYLAIPLALGMIMWIAFTYLTAGGDSGKVAKAKSMIVPFLFGLFWILAAFLVVRGFLGYFLADDIGGSSSSESFINKYLGN